MHSDDSGATLETDRVSITGKKCVHNADNYKYNRSKIKSILMHINKMLAPTKKVHTAQEQEAIHL